MEGEPSRWAGVLDQLREAAGIAIRFHHVERVAELLEAYDREDPDVVLIGVRDAGAGSLGVLDALAGDEGLPAIVILATVCDDPTRRRLVARGVQEVLVEEEVNGPRLARALEHAFLRSELLVREALAVRRLVDRAQELEQYAHAVSHDLKQPLASLLLEVGRIESGLREARPDDARDLGAVAEEIRAMTRIIDELLSIALAGQARVELAPVDLGAVFDRAVDFHRAEIEEIGATVRCSRLPVVHGHEPLLDQLARNLVSNAIKYRGERPLEVYVSARRRGRTWKFVVEDNGVGIPEDRRSSIFDLFVRASDRSEGTGFGLALCRRIVERHGGRIWAGQSPSGGARLVFTLPRLRIAGESEDS